MNKKLFVRMLLESRCLRRMHVRSTRKYSMRSTSSNDHYFKFKASGILTEVCGRQLFTLTPCCKQNSALITRGYAEKHEDSEDNETDSEEDIFSKDPFSDIDFREDTSRSLLYPTSSDPIICKLNECESVHEVFDLVVQYEQELSGLHITQAILVLRDLQKAFLNLKRKSILSDMPDSILDNKMLYAEFNTELCSYEQFQLMLNILQSRLSDLTPDAATCSLLYLLKLGMLKQNSIIPELITYIDSLISKEGSLVPLSALSRFTVAVNYVHYTRRYLMLEQILPLIFSKIDTCSTVEEIELVTVCLSNSRSIIGLHIFELYKTKVLDMMDKEIITSKNTKTIIKILHFVSNSVWDQQNADIIKRLMLSLKGRISYLSIYELITLHKIFANQLEPANILQEIKDTAQKFLAESPEFSSAFYMLTDLLLCVISFSSPLDKPKFENQMYTHIMKAKFPQAIPILYKTLRSLKMDNPLLYNTFWSRVVQNLKTNKAERGNINLLRLCHRYMYFNNNLGGTYRHMEFENYMINLLLDQIDDVWMYLPSKASKIISFLIGYGGCKMHKNDLILKIAKEKLNHMSSQLNVVDCTIISKGLQIFMKMQQKIPIGAYQHLVQINSILNECSRVHLETEDYYLQHTNTIFRTFLNRNISIDIDMFPTFINRYENFTGSMTSRKLCDTIYNLRLSKTLIPKVIDQLAEYVINSGPCLLGDTVGKVLSLCYFQGYVPSNVDKLLSVASETIIRDKTIMTGLQLLQTTLSLCFLNHLPLELVHFIFNIEFLEKMDLEIANCYAKFTYPARLRKCLMLLNRSVCLDFPEVDVPWFHKKYCEEMIALEPADTSLFHKEVKNLLVDMFGGKEFVTQNGIAPYGIVTDFQFFLNSREEAVPVRYHTDKSITKFAVELYKENAFCKNIPALKGLYQMKQRHLEILGYKVIGISETLWNSMYMTEQNAKQNFLKNKIWRNNTWQEQQCIFQK